MRDFAHQFGMIEPGFAIWKKELRLGLPL